MKTPVLDVVRPAMWASARMFFGIRFEGIEHIPQEGPLLITPNHVTFADPPLVSIPIRRPIHYMAWDRLFDIPGFAWLIRRLRAFPVDIESADPRATRAAVRLLDDGHAVMIFPEAARSLDGKLQRFKLGAFRLACARGVPVLPVTILGGHEAWPPGRMLPRPGRLTIIYHPVVTPPAGGDLRHAARVLADRVRAAVASRLPATFEPPAPDPRA
ncbi:MAG TPA: lysophospholipid acyltransferase family protein [Candidatus Nitrosocosmicus sp.]|nr:lysophospholipid acyltransferase family protein [Candidatus Nitrosocosmicus sp.]